VVLLALQARRVLAVRFRTGRSRSSTSRIGLGRMAWAQSTDRGSGWLADPMRRALAHLLCGHRDVFVGR
jgi:hypothetical protein